MLIPLLYVLCTDCIRMTTIYKRNLQKEGHYKYAPSSFILPTGVIILLRTREGKTDNRPKLLKININNFQQRLKAIHYNGEYNGYI
ncbi:MAG: hypothetical protein COA54_12905 [Thiotrichaceae bacterium]|nr:MAG: hypothetical protein COA54_12905 [Thiotrichaceae bacterium]